MSPQAIESRLAVADLTVSTRLNRSADEQYLMVLCHGAGAGLEHAHMTALASALNQCGVSTLRINFPYMELGKRRTDNLDTCLATIGAAMKELDEIDTTLPRILGGHSFGGRMASHFAANETSDVQGPIYFSFPLHPAKNPAIKRAEHLSRVQPPQLFLSGDRDDLADKLLLNQVIASLTNAEVHWLDTANHSYQTLKRSRTRVDTVYDEICTHITTWLALI